MLTTVIDSFGTVMALGWHSDNEQEIVNEAYCCWLHKICENKEPNFISPNFAWAWSNPKKFVDGWVSREVNKYFNKSGIEFEGDRVLALFEKRAKDKLLQLKKEHAESFVYIKNATRPKNSEGKSVDGLEIKTYSMIAHGGKTPRPSDELVYF